MTLIEAEERSKVSKKKNTIHLDRQFLKLYCKSRAGSTTRKRANMIKRALESNDGIWECRLCGGSFGDLGEVTIDHVVPLCFKECNAYHVVQLAHPRCNSQRQHMPVDFFFMLRTVENRFPDHIQALNTSRKRRERSERKRAERLAHKERWCNVQVLFGIIDT